MTTPRPSTIGDDLLPRGWFDAEEAAFYREEASKIRGGLICEIGVYLGRSLSSIAAACRENRTRLVAIDNWRGCVEIGEEKNSQLQLLDHFRANMQWLGLWDAVEPVEGDSAGAASNFADHSIDLVFLDASHDFESVCRDARAWWPKLKPSGVLMGHDYYPTVWPGLVSAVNHLFTGPDRVRGTVWKVGKNAESRLRA